MSRAVRFSYGTVRESHRRAIFVVRIEDALLELHEIAEVAERMREKLATRGEITAEVVVVQGDRKETFRLYGSSYSVARVRTAMFNAAVSWATIELDL
jgi:hypothetical protein